MMFDSSDVERIPMKVVIGLMKEAFQLLSEGKVEVPLRSVLETSDHAGVALFMPSYSPTWNLFGLKMVSVFAGNTDPMPVIQGKMLVMSADNGTPMAILDAASVTSLRTGAASGLATDRKSVV